MERDQKHTNTYDAFVERGEKGQSEPVCLQRTCLVCTHFSKHLGFLYLTFLVLLIFSPKVPIEKQKRYVFRRVCVCTVCMCVYKIQNRIQCVCRQCERPFQWIKVHVIQYDNKQMV